jgi:hypothetical protein
LEKDAFFDDEWASTALAKNGIAMNPVTGCHFNKFDVSVALARTTQVSLPNPLQNPAIALQLEPGGQQTGGYGIFVPSALAALPPSPGEIVPVTLYAGPGIEFCRHGLRTFFERTTNQVLIGMPGTEPTTFGFGLTTAQIDGLFTAIGLPGVNWQITVLVGFSTGYQGINGTINNTKSALTPAPAGTPTGVNPGLGLDLSRVKKLVFMDCLYRGDNPKPGHNTQRALTALTAFTGGSYQVIIYEVTEPGGTPRDGGKLRVNFPSGMNVTLLNLKPLTNQLKALILARRIDNGIKDGFTNELQVRSLGGQPVLDLIKFNLPGTRSVASSPATGTLTLANWAPASLCNNAAAVAEKLRDAILVGPQISQKPKRFANELMGWAPPSMGEALHDGFMSEFGWEHMPG